MSIRFPAGKARFKAFLADKVPAEISAKVAELDIPDNGDEVEIEPPLAIEIMEHGGKSLPAKFTLANGKWFLSGLGNGILFCGAMAQTIDAIGAGFAVAKVELPREVVEAAKEVAAELAATPGASGESIGPL